MLVPVKWMKEYMDLDESVREIADKVTLTGSHVDSINNCKHGIKGIVVGKILKIEKHPDADKLVICTVDIGEKEEIIVTAAKNVFEGAYLPVSLNGSVLADGTVIGDHDFRGVLSHGMFCSYKELGFEDSVIPKEFKDGVLIFNKEILPGTSVEEVLDMDDSVIEFEITPNRPDCLSILGMARETAAAFGKKVKLPEIRSQFQEVSEKHFEDVKIETDSCSKISLRVLTDVEIKESPNWMQNYLMKAGMRPVNNIVDITNFVMLELGQPLHAYDLDKLTSKKIVVKEAKNGQTVKLLDDKDYKLCDGDIVITDGDEILGLAGIMGGLSSHVTNHTKNILIEGAHFDRENIRNTSKRLSLRSEASTRFEKGIALALADLAVNRALTLAEDIGAGKASNEIYKADSKEEVVSIKMRYDRVNGILGTELDKKQMIDYLELLEFTVEDRGDFANVIVPGFRNDCEIEEDLVEEVGRMYGFHNIKPQIINGDLIKGGLSKERKTEDFVKDTLVGLAYHEALSYSFISPNANKKALIDDVKLNDFIRLINPLGEEFSVMRTTIMTNMLDILAKNQKNKQQDLAIFELGNVFAKNPEGKDPLQLRRLVAGKYGNVDFYDFKADLVHLLEKLGIRDVRFEKEENFGLFHKGRCAKVYLGDEYLGIIGEVDKLVMDNYGFIKRAYIFELDMDLISKLSNLQVKYKKINKFPQMQRDIALMVDDDVTARDIEMIIRSVDSPLIKDVRLFDIYKGDQVASGKKSMAYQIIYENSERTLVEEEVSKVQKEIMEKLEEALGISLRK